MREFWVMVSIWRPGETEHDDYKDGTVTKMMSMAGFHHFPEAESAESLVPLVKGTEDGLNAAASNLGLPMKWKTFVLHGERH